MNWLLSLVALIIWLSIIASMLYLWFKKNQTLFPEPIWWWRYIVLLRVPIIAALILLYFPIIATKYDLSILGSSVLNVPVPKHLYDVVNEKPLLILYFGIISVCIYNALKPSKVWGLAIFFNFIFHFFISFIDISSLFENLFIMTKGFQLGVAFVTITSTTLMVSLVFSTTFVNAPIRYSQELGITNTNPPIDRYDIDNRRATYTDIPLLINTWIYKLAHKILYRYLLSFLLSLPSWITIVYFSVQDTNDSSEMLTGILCGLAVSLFFYVIVWVFALIIEHIRIQNTSIEYFITRRWSNFLNYKGDPSGYLYRDRRNPIEWEFEPGHVLGISLGLIGSIIYLYLGSQLRFMKILLILIFLFILICVVFIIKSELRGIKKYLSLFGTVVFAIPILFEILNPHFLSLDFPALMYLLLIIWVVTSFLGGATFYADYFKIPLLTALIIFSGFSYGIFQVDHFFELNSVSINNEVKELQLKNTDEFYKTISDFTIPLKKRLEKQEKKENKGNTLVLVAASGGGIQAAGWTVQVLQGLNKELSNSFTDSIGMISSVSGGSVGNMFFLNELINSKKDKHKDLNPYLETALFNSMTDSLDAVGWGLAYSDFFRGIGMPFFDKYIDRASALDKDWEQIMKQEQHPPTLRSWREHIWNGDIPIPVFNATLVEDGRRFLISPLKFIDASLSQIVTNKFSPSSPESTALDFYTLYQVPKLEYTCNRHKKYDADKIYDLKISTAARLSASFPYVSPLARNYPNNCIKIDREDQKFNYHVADGGYFDNAGIHTIIEWLSKEKNHTSVIEVLRDELKVKRILILQINAFPKPKLKAQNGSLGWTTEFIGPISTLNKVRDSTQIARNQQEVKLFKKAWEQKCNSEENNHEEKKCNLLEIEELTIYFPEIDSYEPPLSWNLSNAQKENIKTAWDKVVTSSDFCRLKNIWEKWDNQ